jgi:glyoxylase-like metal-dependent hydrolase (beta-lactamase superfamily II)
MSDTRQILGSGVSYFDLDFLGLANAIATAVITGPSGTALVDPGPSSCLESLDLGLQSCGMRLADVTDLLLTHIHLDHAGVTGTLVRQYPHIRVHVHERGARHLVDPSKLIDSAARFFGDANMRRFWGEIAPVPPERLAVLQGGERIDVAGRTFDVLYTPGHASHHVTYFDPSSGLAFVGDTAGIRVNGGHVLPPTPPPDIDVALWSDSVDRISALRPETIFITHFGPHQNVEPHLQTVIANLRSMTDMVRQSLETDGTDEQRSRDFGERLRREIESAGDPVLLAAYEPTAPLESLWYGLARYVRKTNS